MIFHSVAKFKIKIINFHYFAVSDTTNVKLFAIISKIFEII